MKKHKKVMADTLPKLFKNEDDSRIECSLAGMCMRTPVLTASGTFGYGKEFAKLKDFPFDSLGAMVLKSVTIKPKLGNPEPRYVETPAGVINSIGLQNIGIKSLVEKELPRLRHFNTNVIVSIAGNSVEDYFEAARVLRNSDDYEGVEVNISCPNVEKQGMLFSFDPEVAAYVTKIVKGIIKEKPVFMKLSPNAPDIVSTALACVKAGADGVSLVNTFSAIAIDIEKKMPILKRNYGGYSGPAIKPIALGIVAKVALKFREENISIPIIGIGGIQTANDAIEYILAGASAVGVGTALFYDSNVTLNIVKGIKEYCLRHNKRIPEIIGTLKMHSVAESLLMPVWG